MKPAEILDLDERNVAASLEGHPFAVVAFMAPSSATCRAFAEVFTAAAMQHPDLLFARVDTEAHPAIAAHFDVRSVMALMIFRQDIVVYAKAGAMQGWELDEVLAAVRALDMGEVRRKVAGDVASVESLLRPSARAALNDAAPRLARGGLLVVPDAFEPDFAEALHSSLDACPAWRVHEGQEDHFHYHHHNLYDPADHPPELARCIEIFDAPSTKAWMSRLSGRQCTGTAEVSASWYLPGDHSLPHNDIASVDQQASRQVAFVWHLTKDWRPEWGGALYWCSKGRYLPPAFNTLYLFNVGPDSNHFVTHVSPYARGKRLAVNGWWTGPSTTEAPREPAPERIADILVY
jgi:Rps23 Pro-64 3,4-dihydroxylase Tpa1-like proline 4-hydroxylase/thiol-disulfide isomerase/thioredoxin